MTTNSLRHAVTDLNVRRGLQGACDLASIKRHGKVDSPAIPLYREMALEFAKRIDSERPKRRRRDVPDLVCVEV
jgi:hypothetical protein